MRPCELSNAGLYSSVLGFGCEAIMGRTGRKDSLCALSAAWDAGITFYDTARSYRYGDSEDVLGEFLRTRRDQAIISTKFGILASQQPLWKRAGKPVARAAVRKRAGSEITSNQFAVATFEHSLNESLRKLRTDYVDLLFMHESTESVLSRDDLLLALEKLVTSGKVRVEGISAAPSIIKEALLKKPRPSSLPSSRSTYSTFRQRPQLPPLNRAGGTGIANHPFGGVAGVQQSRAILREFASTVPAELRAKLGDVGDSVLSDVVLNLILTTPGIQVVIPHDEDDADQRCQFRLASPRP